MFFHKIQARGRKLFSQFCKLQDESSKEEFMKHQKMNRILAAALSAACLVPFAAMVPVDADAADIMSALEIHTGNGTGLQHR